MPQLTIQQTFEMALRHHEAGQLQDAERLYRQILARRPAHADALHLLGVIAHQAGRNDDAVDLIRQAIALRFNFAEAHVNLGVALEGKGQIDEAIAAYRRAIVLSPDFAEAYSNLGSALKQTGRLNEAIAACRQAIALKPDYAQAHSNLANALRDAGGLDEAIAASRQAIALRPSFAEARMNLGNALGDEGQLDEAIAAYREAIALNPKRREAHSNLIFAMHAHPDCDAHAIAEENHRWNQQHAEPLRKFIQPHSNDRDPSRRLRIGYVSSDFWAHASSYFLIPLFENHDPRESEVFCYAQVLRNDEITERMRRRTAGWRSVVGLSDAEIANKIREDRIDILVDLKLHTANNRLLVFARKPAPVQVTWLGYPGSTGLGTIDYRLSDPYLDPPGMDESIYSERTIRLPDSFWCYDPLDGREISVNSPPALETGIITFGCLNQFSKINERILALWAQVLREVEKSRLILLAPEGSHRQRTLDCFSRNGVDPVRIEFVPRQPRRRYLELYRRIDLGLDSFPYNGHTTSLDSFWMGVPVVTLVGQTAVSRAGWCQLSNLGLAHLAGHTAGQFVRIAVELARDLPGLTEMRSTLRRRMEASPLMEASKFADSIEAAYRQMWREWCVKGSLP